MSEKRSSQMTKIMTAIKEGHLTKHELEGRLKAAIDHEYAHGNPPNAALINACEDLLLHLEGDELSFTSSNARLHQLIEQNGCKESHSRGWAMRPLRLAVAFMVVIAISFGIGSAVRWQWFDIGSTPDEQQYFVKGQEVSVDAIQKAIAEHNEASFVMLEEIDEISNHLGFSIDVPSFLAQKWTFEEGTLFFFPDMIQLSLHYVNAERPGQIITYACSIFTDAENAYLTYEQNQSGKHLKGDGWEAYMSINDDASIICWQKDIMFCVISGPFSECEGKEITNDLLGGIRNE